MLQNNKHQIYIFDSYVVLRFHIQFTLSVPYFRPTLKRKTSMNLKVYMSAHNLHNSHKRIVVVSNFVCLRIFVFIFRFFL